MFSKNKKITHAPDNIPVAADVCEMFMIGEKLKPKLLIAPSLLSCVCCVFLTKKVGFIYHSNCGIMREPMIKMIINALIGNKEKLQDTKIILATSGSEPNEFSRMTTIVTFFEEKGFDKKNIEIVYNAAQYTVNSQGKHGVLSPVNEAKFSKPD